ncbi:MAG: hypothetical protein Q8O03_00600 [Nanoarchaeota archaeon]|nr:hypothetical protein [Nanoarchaeota archaeon]
MKIPKTFIPNKDLEETIETLLLEKTDENNYDKEALSRLLKSFGTFTKQLEKIHPYLDDIYKLGENLANKMPYFTKDDLEELSKRLISKDNLNLYSGFYLSALVNKIITENDVITLNINLELYGISAYQKKGTTIVKGDLGYFTGHFLEGATLIVEGNTGNRTGNGMKIGKIVVTGGTGEDTGDFMTGGEIITYGKIKSIASSCKGTIYSQGKKLR